MEKWLIAFFIGLAFSVVVYMVNNFLYIAEEKEQSSNQEYMINKIDNLSAQRDEEQSAQTKVILTNITHKVDEVKEDAHKNRQILEVIVRDQNITIINGNVTNVTLTNASGTVSGIGKPIIIPIQ